MIVRTEFSFRKVFGPVEEVVARLPPWGGIIADDGCWGHVPFAKECAKAGKRGILGCRFPVGAGAIVVVPRDASGLKALYGAVALANPREALQEGHPGWALVALGPTSFPGALPFYTPSARPSPGGFSGATADNLYPTPADRQAWQLMLGRGARTPGGAAHILSPAELALEGATPEQIAFTRRLVEESETPLPRAENIRFPVEDVDRELAAMCAAELTRRGLGEEYRQRMEYELKLIAEKKYADYFLVIADLMHYAKGHMLVGPARGSSCGSLVCWLTRITEIDPLRYGLIFERFIDVNRFDLPDIDIDFPDDKRHMIISYLGAKYGEANVAHIGNVIRYKPKSALTDVAKQLTVPLWELDKLKDVIIERSSGDSRASSCLEDSFKDMEVGRSLVERYPLLRVATRLEEHARSSGVHAAGIIVANAPVSEYCGVREGVAQLDKKMAEAINILKIDALGLRTLSVIEECCALIGRDPLSMYDLPQDDAPTFALLNAGKFSGVFQFEGLALQSVAKQVRIDNFMDVAAITALARPGPLSSGETTRWIQGKNSGRIQPMHPALEPYTRETFGTMLYQEQVMLVIRQLGKFSWADTSIIRKVMSNRQGNEAFAKFEKLFMKGATENGITALDADRIWKAINTFGSWAFNKSHAVAYGAVSYWTARLKAHHPVEFAVANLRHARDDDAAIKTLRDLMREGGIDFVPVDPVLSTERWEFSEGKLLGPLTGIKGCGAKTAREILMRRANGIKLTARQSALLASPSKFADYSPCRKLWGHLYADPKAHFKSVEAVHEIEQLQTNTPQQWVLVGKLMKKNLRDLNEEKYLVRRNGKRVPDGQHNMLLFHIEDDTGTIICCIGAKDFLRIGKKMVEEAAIGQWFAVAGRIPRDFKMLQVEKVKWL